MVVPELAPRLVLLRSGRRMMMIFSWPGQASILLYKDKEEGKWQGTGKGFVRRRWTTLTGWPGRTRAARASQGPLFWTLRIGLVKHCVAAPAEIRG